jgi:hypothetical protein
MKAEIVTRAMQELVEALSLLQAGNEAERKPRRLISAALGRLGVARDLMFEMEEELKRK